MVSQLLKNDKISFVCARSFSSRGKDYEVGDDFPQEDARDIEVFVRSRYVIPVVDSIEDKQHIRHWHRHVRPKDEVLARLERERVQLRMPHEYDSEDEVALEVLTHPHTTPEPQGDGVSALPEETTTVTVDEPAEPPEDDPKHFDPADYTVQEVKDYIALHPEEEDRIIAAEESGRGRKGLLEE